MKVFVVGIVIQLFWAAYRYCLLQNVLIKLKNKKKLDVVRHKVLVRCSVVEL